MSRNVHIIGVGVVPFAKPGEGGDYAAMGARAASDAMNDAGIGFHLVEQAVAGYVYGDSCSGQAALYRLGLTGIPIFNVNNTCATGSTALYLARQIVEGGAADCVMALGFEQMPATPMPLPGRHTPWQRVMDVMQVLQEQVTQAPTAAQLFGGAARMHMQLYGTRASTFARIAVKARRHAAGNPLAMHRESVTLEQVLASPRVFAPLTRLQCCSPACGAAAALLCSSEFARRHGLDARVRIVAQAMCTDGNSSFDENDLRKLAGYDMTRRAALAVYEASGIGPEDISVAELHDCFTTNELISYEALALVPEGEGERWVLDGANTYDGRVVTNPSGGLLSRGNAPGASGLAQCAELVWQLRGQAGKRQVANARIALQHELGLGGVSVVSLYRCD